MYVDNTFVIWPYGIEELQKLHQNFKNITSRNQVHNGNRKELLPFPDVLVTKKPDGSLGHSV
jgi:hypothetical protein